MTDLSRYDRQWRVPQIRREGQEKINAAQVAVVGLGALGSVSANLLARAGVGHLVLIDRDFPELNNLQRQVLYDESDVRSGLPKAVIAEQKLRAANHSIAIQGQTADLNVSTIAELLHGVDLIVDGCDNYETRYLLNDYALKNRIPWIYGGVICAEGISYVILPGEGPCLRCLFTEPPAPEKRETCDQSGVLASAAHLVASFQVTEALKILAGAKQDVDRRLWRMDLWKRNFHAVGVDDHPLCEGCSKGIYPFLSPGNALETIKMCGRNAVQIHAAESKAVDFKKLAEKLAGQVPVEYNEYVFNIRPDSFEIMVFANGRAIVRGTEDAGRAKSLYARYVGA